MDLHQIMSEEDDTKRHIDDNTADIRELMRELMLENQRILRYLESIVNRS